MNTPNPTRRTILGSMAAGAMAPAFLNLRQISVNLTDANRPLRLGIVTDPQYADKPTVGSRRYSEAAVKLEAAIAGINQANVDLLVHLGDAIDGEPNAEVHAKRIFDIFATSEAPAVHLVGNHCLDGGKALYDRASGQVAYHGAMRFHGWRFLLLDGNAISIRGHAPNSPAYREAVAMINAGHVSWGGGLGKQQSDWVTHQLADAQAANENVLLFCHFPIDAAGNPASHLLWHHGDVAKLIARHDCVKAWFCGHNHQGGYGHIDGIHHVTFPAICDAPQASNAWAIAELKQNQIQITGYGTVPSRNLNF